MSLKCNDKGSTSSGRVPVVLSRLQHDSTDSCEDDQSILNGCREDESSYDVNKG